MYDRCFDSVSLFFRYIFICSLYNLYKSFSQIALFYVILC